MSTMKRLMKLLCLLSVCATGGGCTNGFSDNYRGERCTPVKVAQVCLEQPAQTRLIGSSSFVSAAGEGESQALATARSVGADFVIWSTEYCGTTQSTGAVPITSPTSSTTQFNSYSQGQVWGQRGYAGQYSQNTYGTATTYGTQTTYVPFTVVHHWMQYSAKFYRSVSLDVPATTRGVQVAKD